MRACRRNDVRVAIPSTVVRLPHTLHAELTPVIERLYRAFPLSPLGDRCLRWMDMTSPEWELRLTSEGKGRQVRNLTEEAFDHLGWHAMCWDAEHPETVQFFLPRLVDEIVAHRLDYSRAKSPVVELEMLSEKLAGHDWRHWPAGRGEVLAGTFLAVWRHARVDRPWAGDTAAGPILAAGMNVAELRDEAAGWPLPEQADLFVDLAQALVDESRSLADPFEDWAKLWGDFGASAEKRHALGNWLREPFVAELLEEEFFRADPVRQQKLSDASQRLRFWQP